MRYAQSRQKRGNAAPTGRERVEEFETLLTEAGRGVSSCCICGADGHPSTSGASEDADSDGDEEDDDESELHFTVLTGLDFSNRSVVLKRAGVRGWGLGFAVWGVGCGGRARSQGRDEAAYGRATRVPTTHELGISSKYMYSSLDVSPVPPSRDAMW